MIETPQTGAVYGLYAERNEHERRILEEMRGVVAAGLAIHDANRDGTYEDAAARLIEHLATRDWMLVRADSLIL